MELRSYQQAAIAAAYAHLREREDNPVIELPTGAGKSLICATICRDAVKWGGRVVVLAHVKELLTQHYEHLVELDPSLPIGIYSAGLGTKDAGYPVTVAGIQSAVKHPELFGHQDIVIVDESHRVPAEGEGQYRSFLSALKERSPDVRLIGLTATPFRTSSGPLCTSDGIFNKICYRIGVRELIARGYLCPLVSRAGVTRPMDAALDDLTVRAGEFVSGEMAALFDAESMVGSACAEILDLTRERKSVLVFCAGVEHARKVAARLGGALVVGETPADERDRVIRMFRAGSIKYLCNVDVLTLGFDAPNVDCVALLRATASPGLMYQMIGRSFRIAPSKQDALVLDYGNNIVRHGPVDMIRPRKRAQGTGDAPAKECPECHALIAAGYSACPVCGHEFPTRRTHGITASGEDILSGRVSDSRYEVREVLYAVHVKRGAPAGAPRTMRVDYSLGDLAWISEWVCFEHRGFARTKARQWWRKRADTEPPTSAAEAVERAGELREPTAIVVRAVSGEKYERVIGYEWEKRTVVEDHVPTLEEACAEEIGF